jgi:hypothetical protein
MSTYEEEDDDVDLGEEDGPELDLSGFDSAEDEPLSFDDDFSDED